MEFRREGFDDSLYNADGSCEARYVGETFTFELDDGQSVVVRSYDDEPGLAALIQPTTWYTRWLESAAVRPMLDALRDAGVERLRLFNQMSGAYDDVLLLGPERSSNSENRAG